MSHTAFVHLTAHDKVFYAEVASHAAEELNEGASLNKDQLTALWDDWVGTVFEDSSCESIKDLVEAIESQVKQYFEQLDEEEDEEEDGEKCVECGEVVGDEEGWRDSKLKLFCDDCKEGADNYEEEDEEESEVDGDGFVVCEHCGKGGGAHASEDCPDYDYEECCDTGCKFSGHWVKKVKEDEEEDEVEKKCDNNCGTILGKHEHIHILTKGDEEEVWCSECFHQLWPEMKADGWSHDEEDEVEKKIALTNGA